MSMEYRTIIELIQVFIAYTSCVFLVPYFVFHSYLRKKTFSYKLILCTLIGNFYIINIVFLIFLVHIPGKLSLYVFTIVPIILGWIKVNRPRIRRFFSLLTTAFSRLFLGEAKIKTILNILFYQPKKLLHKGRHGIFSHIKHHFIEWIMLIGILGFDVWYYGYQTVTKYVYGTSDIVVHHEWVNQMDEGVIFYHGIYPFGFHNTIYFLHNFWGIQTLSILRVFGVIEMLYIYIMLYLLLRQICRSRYIPILGVFIFSVPHIFNFQGTMRYQWSLPQEFAMIFLYPCAYFLIQFFKRKKEELRIEKELKSQNKLYTWLAQYSIRPSTRSLIFCAISFSLTLAAHFYITIIAIFLCLAVFMSYFPLAFYYRYFLPIVAAAIISVCMAVMPMGIGYLQGTDIEGSLRWALSAMSSGSESTNDTEPETTPDSQNATNNSNSDTSTQTETDKSENQDTTKIANDSSNTTIDTISKDTNNVSQKWSSFIQSITSLVDKVINKIHGFNLTIKPILENVYDMYEIIDPLLISMELLMVFSFIMIVIRRHFYYRNLFGVCIYLFFMIILMCASDLSLPSVMDGARARLFLTYATPLFAACLVDAVYAIICRPFHYHRFTEILPIGLTAALLYLTITNHLVKPLNIMYSLQFPGEMKCNYQIMESYPDKTWTLVTTTNSYSLIRQKGWLYEACTFLEEMDKYNKHKRITIPTKYVFFYIEKYPLDYGTFDLITNSPRTIGYVSEAAAKDDAEYSGGSVYSGTNRFKLESKLFYWAKAFEKEYPSEFQVYYEDESFICYRIVQNEYNLYNFAIDYDFNN